LFHAFGSVIIPFIIPKSFYERNISFSILSKEDGIHFIQEKNFFTLMYMATSHCPQPENQVIEREEESCENLRSNCVKKEEKM